MNKTVVRLKRIGGGSPDRDSIKRLYHTAFPADERAPYLLLQAMALRKNVDFWGLYCEDEWVGFMYVVNYHDLSYIFYFAIDDKARGKGCGSAALKTILKKYRGRRVFLAIEQIDKNADNYAERVARKRFYQRAGFCESGLKMREASMVYELLCCGGKPTSREYQKLMGSVMGPLAVKLFRLKIFS